MDAFLRRVVESREREQQERAFLPPTRCRLCGAQLKVHDNGSTPLTLCRSCGGRKRQEELEEEDRRRERAAKEEQRLVQLAGITPMEIEMTEKRTCPTEGCGKTLRSDNTRGICSGCALGKKPGAPKEPSAPRAAPKTTVRKRFFTLAEALEQDPNELLERFMQGWINQLRNRVGANAD